MKAKKLLSLILETVMVLNLAGCQKSGTETGITKSVNEEHEPITIMSANKADRYDCFGADRSKSFKPGIRKVIMKNTAICSGIFMKL